MKKLSNDVQRVALYIRVSTEEQAQHGYSLEAQENALVEFANANNYKVVGIYRDEGFSARKSVIKRKVMQELLQDVEQNKIDLILFTKLDRWFRNVRDYHTVQTILDRHNVSWKAILEDYNTTTADGRLKVNIMLSVAENEADRTSERIKFVLDNKLKNGEYCFADCPLGYKVKIIDGKRKLVKDPDTEHIVKAFWDKMIKYRNFTKSGREMNIEFNFSRAATMWRRMFLKEIYTGYFRGIPNFCPAYIDRKTWEELQIPEKRIKSTRQGRCYLFVGLLRCPICGHTLKSNYRFNKPNPEKIFYSYRCNYRTYGVCTFSRSISEKYLEEHLLSNIKYYLDDYITKVDAFSRSKKNIPKTDINKLQEKLRRLNVIYMDGNISDNEYNSQSSEIKAAIKKAEQEEKHSVNPVQLSTVRDLIDNNFESLYQQMTRQEKQFFWHSIIEEIRLGDNQVSEVIFRV